MMKEERISSASASTTASTAVDASVADDVTNVSTCSSSNLSITRSERDSDGCYDDVGFMFDAQQASTLKRLVWGPVADDGEAEKDSQNKAHVLQSTAARNEEPIVVRVALHVVDDEPGALQSGHYLWPAAPAMAEFLIQMMCQQQQQQQQQPSKSSSKSLSSLQAVRRSRNVLELGAGTALLSLTALQLMKETLQCVVVTDHDPGTLERARDSYETTLEDLLESTSTEEEQLDCINALASIPIMFETFEWGNIKTAEQVATAAGEHGSNASFSSNDNHHPEHVQQSQEESNNNIIGPPNYNPERNIFDLLLGSDLIYSNDVVEPLLRSVSYWMTPGGSFLLAQSFVFDDETEQIIDSVCHKLQLQRTTLQREASDTPLEKGKATIRIQQYTWKKTESSSDSTDDGVEDLSKESESSCCTADSRSEDVPKE